ncbi:MAG: dephospho-CoA kinase [Rhodothermales bacterium]|nr:dephospho-CoA kinase [Rhodothermales bacterium]
MKSLGVTGGIGSGKTTVCRMLEGMGAEVFYADAEARRLMNDDAELRKELVAAFGERVYDAAGRLDRAYLAREVFGDSERLARLNGLVHPRVRRALQERKAGAAHRGAPLLVYEAALIYETGGERYVDAVAVVQAPVALRIERVTTRDGVEAHQVEARMQHQLPPETLRERADFLIENDGDLEHLRRQTEALYRRMVVRSE